MIILYGDNILASRKRLNELIDQAKSKGWDIAKFDGVLATLSQLRETTESKNLFGNRCLPIIERFFSSLSSKRKTEISEYLKTENPQAIIWEDKTIDGRSLVPYKNAKTEIFKIPPTLFKFLDNLKPNNPQNNLLSLRQALNQNAPEMIIWWLERHFRQLIMAAELSGGEMLHLPVWKKGLLLSQAKKIGYSSLRYGYEELLKIEREEKTGFSCLPLSSRLDLLMTSL